MKKVLVLVGMCLLLTGCATKGRFSLVDVNGWEPSQMTASVPEDTIVYKCEQQQPAGPLQMAPGVNPIYEFIADIIKALKGFRIKLISLEWNECAK